MSTSSSSDSTQEDNLRAELQRGLTRSEQLSGADDYELLKCSCNRALDRTVVRDLAVPRGDGSTCLGKHTPIASLIA